MPDPLQSTEIGLRAVLDLSNMQKNSTGYKGILADLQKVTQAFTNQSKSGSDSVSTALSGVGDMFKRVSAIVYGIVIADTFRSVEKAVGGLVQEAFDAVSVFQGLQIQFTTLAARDYARTFGGSAGDAISKVSAQTKELLLWVRQIAVTTPYSVESLGNMLALSNAYGYTTAEAKDLVISVGNFTSAMGVGDDVATRMIYSMGQMVSQGKIMNREIRELANAFVPVYNIQDMLAAKYGKTRLEIAAMMKTGEISAKEWVGTFEEMVARDYPGAMARMSRTFVAVMNNLKDLVQSMFGYEIFGQVADKISNILQDMLQSFLTPQNYALAGAIGSALSFSFDKLLPVVQQAGSALTRFFSTLGMNAPTVTDLATDILYLTSALDGLGTGFSSGLNDASDFINGLLSTFGTSMSDLTTKMQEWGQNVVLAFAKGIAGAAGMVLDALGGIATMISDMLRSNSPPKILPHIGEWGTSTMQSFLDGFIKAKLPDFAPMADGIRNALRSVGNTGPETPTSNPSNPEMPPPGWDNPVAQQAISNAIQRVQDIVSAISMTFASPLILSDLDKYGAEAMDAYLQGFNEADLTVFDTITSEIDGLMKSMADSTNTEEFVNSIIQMNLAVAQGVQEWQQYGEMGSDAISKVMEAIGISSTAVSNYIQSALDVQKFSAISDAVKSMFDFTGDFPVDVFGQAIDSFQQLSSIAGEFGSNLSSIVQSYAQDSQALINVNNQIISAQTRVDASTARVTAAQADLNKITAQYDAILTELNAELTKVNDQQEDLSRVKVINKTLDYTILTDDERKRLELEKQQIYLQRQIRDTTTQKTADEKAQQAVVSKYQAEQKAAETQLKYYNDQKSLIDKRISHEKAQINSIVKAEEDAAKSRLAIYKGLIDEEIKLNNVAKTIPPAQAPGGALDQPGGPSQGSTAGKSITDQFDQLWKDIKKKWDDEWATLTAPFAVLVKPWNDLVTQIKNILNDPQFKTSWDVFVSTVEDGFGRIGNVLTTPGSSGKTIGTEIGDILGIIVSNLFISTGPGKPSVIQILADGFDALAKTIEKNRPTIDLIFERLGELLNDHMFPQLEKLLKDIVEKYLPTFLDLALKIVPPLLSLFGFLVDHANIIIAVFAAIYGKDLIKAYLLGQLLDLLGKIMSGLGLMKLLAPLMVSTDTSKGGGAKMASMDEYTVDPFTKMISSITKSFSEGGEATKVFKMAKDSISGFLTDIFGPKGTVEVILVIGTKVISDWWDGLFGEKGSMSTWFVNLGKTVGTFVNGILGPKGIIDTIISGLFGKKGIVMTWSAEFFAVGLLMMSGLMSGIVSLKDHLVSTMGDIVIAVIDFIKAITQAHSDSLVFKGIGVDMMSGWASGISSSGHLPVSAISGVMRMMNTSMAYGLGRNSSSVSTVNNAQSYDQRTYVSVNPTYENMSSPVTIFSDVSAALSASRR